MIIAVAPPSLERETFHLPRGWILELVFLFESAVVQRSDVDSVHIVDEGLKLISWRFPVVVGLIA